MGAYVFGLSNGRGVYRWDEKAAPAVDEQHVYIEVPAAKVDEKARIAAEAMRDTAVDVWYMRGTPAIKWFRPEGPSLKAYRERHGERLTTWKFKDASWGFVDQNRPDTIWLHAGLTPRKVLDITAHECRHVKQAEDLTRDQSQDEADATRCAALLVELLLTED